MGDGEGLGERAGLKVDSGLPWTCAGSAADRRRRRSGRAYAAGIVAVGRPGVMMVVKGWPAAQQRVAWRGQGRVERHAPQGWAQRVCVAFAGGPALCHAAGCGVRWGACVF